MWSPSIIRYLPNHSTTDEQTGELFHFAYFLIRRLPDIRPRGKGGLEVLESVCPPLRSGCRPPQVNRWRRSTTSSILNASPTDSLWIASQECLQFRRCRCNIISTTTTTVHAKYRFVAEQNHREAGKTTQLFIQ